MSTKVLFDLHGVFLTRSVEDSLAQLADVVNLDAAQQFYQAYLELRPELEAGSVSDELWWQQLSIRSGMDQGEISEIARALDSTFELNPEGLNLAHTVLDAGYVTGIFANISPGLAQQVRERFGWLDEFAAIIFSCDIGVCKPHPEAYEVAAEALGGGVKDTVLFDTDESYVEAAIAAGLQAHVYQSPQQVLDILDGLKP